MARFTIADHVMDTDATTRSKQICQKAHDIHGNVTIFSEADSTSIDIRRLDYKRGSCKVYIMKNSRVSIILLTVNGHDTAVFIGAGAIMRDAVIGLTGDRRKIVRGDNFKSGAVRLIVKHEDIRISDDVLFSHGIAVRTSDMHSIYDQETGLRINPPAGVLIENNVWLGQDVIVNRGARIGAHSVIGARAVVTGEIPPHVVAAGAPARIVRENVVWGPEDEP